MEFNDHTRVNSDLLSAKTEELKKLKESLKHAKDDATQSWLDSRPLIDELEKKQAELASSKAKVIRANNTISEIQVQIATTDISIKSTKEEAHKFHIIINEKNQDLYKRQEEMEQLKMKIDQKRKKRSKVKHVLHGRKQTLQTLELTYEAVQLEADSFTMSVAQAVRHISNLEAANIMIRISQEEYDMLKKEAREQNLLAERQISASMEEKLAAEKTRDSALKRLQKLYLLSRSKHKRTTDKTAGDENIMSKTEGNKNIVRSKSNNRNLASSITQVKPPTWINKRNPERRFSNNKHKKKSSIFVGIKTCFCWRPVKRQ